jgi:hypothetical protein
MDTTQARLRTQLREQLTQSLEAAIHELTALSDAQRTCPLKPSRANPDIVWTPCDHFAHLIGTEQYFQREIEKALTESPEAHPQPYTGAPNHPDEDIMAAVHAFNDRWILKHRDKSFAELVAMARETRAYTLALLDRTSDEQLTRSMRVPWGLATIGEVFELQMRHMAMHLGFIREGLAAKA